MNYEIFFKYWYAPLWSVMTLVGGYGIAVLLQHRQFHREDVKRKRDQEAEEESRRPNPIELDILRQCLEQPSEDGRYHFQENTGVPFINERPVGDYLSVVIRENLRTLNAKGHIDIIMDNDFGLSFTIQTERGELEHLVMESVKRHG